MFAGFNVAIEDKKEFYDYYDSGLEIYYKDKIVLVNDLEKYINPDGSLNGKEIENEWFPDIEAQVFLSHSHDDLDFVVSFAG